MTIYSFTERMPHQRW